MKNYKKKGYTKDEKDKIIDEFLPYIKYTAARMSWRLPPQLTTEDLISAGLVGLLDALEKYEHGRVKLKTYAEFRIKGAMLDELRALDWVPRSVKKRISDLKKTYGKLEKELGRIPEEEEVADALGISIDEYYRTLQDASSAISLRFEDFEDDSSTGNGKNILECISAPETNNPLNMLEKKAMEMMLAELIDELPEKEKLLLSLYYWEEMTMKEIGKVMNLTEGRVCQLHTQAIIRLKSKMKDKIMSKEIF